MARCGAMVPVSLLAPSGGQGRLQARSRGQAGAFGPSGIRYSVRARGGVTVGCGPLRPESCAPGSGDGERAAQRVLTLVPAGLMGLVAGLQTAVGGAIAAEAATAAAAAPSATAEGTLMLAVAGALFLSPAVILSMQSKKLEDKLRETTSNLEKSQIQITELEHLLVDAESAGCKARAAATVAKEATEKLRKEKALLTETIDATRLEASVSKTEAHVMHHELGRAKESALESSRQAEAFQAEAKARKEELEGVRAELRKVEGMATDRTDRSYRELEAARYSLQLAREMGDERADVLRSKVEQVQGKFEEQLVQNREIKVLAAEQDARAKSLVAELQGAEARAAEALREVERVREAAGAREAHFSRTLERARAEAQAAVRKAREDADDRVARVNNQLFGTLDRKAKAADPSVAAAGADARGREAAEGRERLLREELAAAREKLNESAEALKAARAETAEAVAREAELAGKLEGQRAGFAAGAEGLEAARRKAADVSAREMQLERELGSLRAELALATEGVEAARDAAAQREASLHKKLQDARAELAALRGGPGGAAPVKRQVGDETGAAAAVLEVEARARMLEDELRAVKEKFAAKQAEEAAGLQAGRAAAAARERALRDQLSQARAAGKESSDRVVALSREAEDAVRKARARDRYIEEQVELAMMEVAAKERSLDRAMEDVRNAATQVQAALLARTSTEGSQGGAEEDGQGKGTAAGEEDVEKGPDGAQPAKGGAPRRSGQYTIAEVEKVEKALERAMAGVRRAAQVD